ncbi:MAG: translation elongation factor Ts [Candidatus Yanofskybacteria bacterium CG10_big_fil_rev_8_21_14_0_10_46_23]|uniref:Elongation factor Ts n=1 Tax=Candidatus Yanofskybacteria bacterium CG10_big_fil_rev_8_21_14_0_10_46_23 TaxID=1975098 RepID=A0A2H0R474_9BACT|nr:MAG: translation elongation factor Ts [Candidatus Yanofskybacteria bacterium CG10_big_fil_rev_8_21_14_0_10_46_23]
MANGIEQVKELRDRTGLSVSKVKEALDQAGGDIEKAAEALKSQGASVAEKKASRETSQGIVETYVHSNRKIGVMVKLLCETDFVARNEEFTNLAHEIALQIASMDPTDVSDLLEQAFIKDPSMKIQDLVQHLIAKLGENIQIDSFIRFSI